MNIIARKPRDASTDVDYVVVDRGPGHLHRWVVASATAASVASGEWFWGHYFATKEDALDAFNRLGVRYAGS